MISASVVKELNGVFPDELQLADVTLLHKKNDFDDKTNYPPLSV